MSSIFMRDSFVLETCTLSFAPWYTCVLLEATSSLRVIHAISSVLLILTCTYGICASNIEGQHAGKFTVGAAILATFSLVTAFANTVVTVTLMFYDIRILMVDLFRVSMHPYQSWVLFVIAVTLKILEITVACLLAVKHIGNSIHLPESSSIPGSFTMELQVIQNMYCRPLSLSTNNVTETNQQPPPPAYV